MKTYGPLVLQKENKVATNFAQILQVQCSCIFQSFKRMVFTVGRKGETVIHYPFQSLNSGQQTFLHPNKFMAAVNM